MSDVRRQPFDESLLGATRMLYASPNCVTKYRLVRGNVQTPLYMRAPGECSGVFALHATRTSAASTSRLRIAVTLSRGQTSSRKTSQPTTGAGSIAGTTMMAATKAPRRQAVRRDGGGSDHGTRNSDGRRRHGARVGQPPTPHRGDAPPHGFVVPCAEAKRKSDAVMVRVERPARCGRGLTDCSDRQRDLTTLAA